MRIITQQTLSTNTTVVTHCGTGQPQSIRRIALVKSNTTQEQLIVYAPYRSEAAAAVNRILDATVGRSGVVEEYSPPWEKPSDINLSAVGTTNMTLVIWGD